MFGRKVECDGCNAKIKAKDSIFHRGSHFCNTACLGVWEKVNPPRTAQGSPDELKHNLIHTISSALDEYKLGQGSFLDDFATRMIPLVGRANADMDAQVRSEHAARFVEYTHECIPIARALGYTDEVRVLEKFGFGGDLRNVIQALQSARDKAGFVSATPA